jgi:hypothetical protein
LQNVVLRDRYEAVPQGESIDQLDAVDQILYKDDGRLVRDRGFPLPRSVNDHNHARLGHTFRSACHHLRLRGAIYWYVDDHHRVHLFFDKCNNSATKAGLAGVIVLCAILNRFRLHKFKWVDQFIMGYGGLRGAIAYGLVESLPDNFPGKGTFVTTTIAIILFTVFIQVVTFNKVSLID